MKQMIGDPSGPPIFKWHFEKINVFFEKIICRNLCMLINLSCVFSKTHHDILDDKNLNSF